MKVISYFNGVENKKNILQLYQYYSTRNSCNGNPQFEQTNNDRWWLTF